MTETKLLPAPVEVYEPTIPVLYDLDLMNKRCTMPEQDFWNLGELYMLTPDEWYVHIDNGADVLAVAHLDYVADNVGFVSMEWEKDGLNHVVVWNGALDDRLGVFLLLDVLPSIGAKFDVLLTTNEEWGNSTAELFKTEKEYNWIFQFDRRGTDVVMYEYETKVLKELLTEVGLHVGRGSFSDICELQDLGCKGFNFGTGYYNEHMKDHHAVLSDTESMCWLFYEFYKAHADTHFTHEKSAYTYYGGAYDWDEYPPTYRSYGDSEVVVDMDVYEKVYNHLIDDGVDPWDADDIAYQQARYKSYHDVHDHRSFRHIGMVCHRCEALVDISEIYEGLCEYCRTVDTYKYKPHNEIHRLTDDEWNILDGGG